MRRFIGILIFLCWVPSLLYTQSLDTLWKENKVLQYRQPYEKVTYPGVRGMGYSVNTYFYLIPLKNIELTDLQKDGLLFSGFKLPLQRGKEYVLVVRQYHSSNSTSKQAKNSNQMIVYSDAKPLISQDTATSAYKNCNRCLSIYFQRNYKKDSLVFNQLNRYSFHAP